MIYTTNYLLILNKLVVNINARKKPTTLSTLHNNPKSDAVHSSSDNTPETKVRVIVAATCRHDSLVP